jgi:hypothetical protein
MKLEKISFKTWPTGQKWPCGLPRPRPIVAPLPGHSAAQSARCSSVLGCVRMTTTWHGQQLAEMARPAMRCTPEGSPLLGASVWQHEIDQLTPKGEERCRRAAHRWQRVVAAVVVTKKVRAGSDADLHDQGDVRISPQHNKEDGTRSAR